MEKKKTKHLFIVEDDATVVKLYEAIFKHEDFTFSFCTEFEFVGDFIITMKPNVVILDLMLTGKVSGFDILEQIKDVNTIPIVVTALTDRETRIKVFELGARDYVTKPIQPVVLRRLVNCYMNLSLF